MNRFCAVLFCTAGILTATKDGARGRNRTGMDVTVRGILSRTGLLDFLGDAGAEFVDEISGLLRVRGGGEDRAAVVLQNFEPVGDIGGVIFAGLQRQFKIGAQEGCAQFGDQFFLGIGVAAEAVAAEVAVKAVFAARPMGQLMRER